MALATQYITLTDPSNIRQPRHLAYYEFGDPANPHAVICVHGLSRNGRDFEALARALGAKYRVVCPDMAGRGNSDWLMNKQDYNYATYIADVLALLIQLGIMSVDWIGTSMGGIIGMMLAAGNPLIIKRLVLNDVGATVSAEGLKRIVSYVGSPGIFTNGNEALAYLQSVLAPFGIQSEEQWQYMLESSCNRLPDGKYALRYDPDISKPLRTVVAENVPVTDIDLSTFWNVIACPTLILRGGLSDILTRETAEAMRNARPNVRLAEFPGVGHAPALLDETQIKTVTDWLDIK